METANTILQQLGGNRFLAMTGAKNLIGGERMLQFDMSSRLTRDKSNKMRITLSDLDLYTVETYRVRGLNCDVKSSVDGVYADQLRKVFTSVTGLDTSL
jgi:hypothetical protein